MILLFKGTIHLKKKKADVTSFECQGCKRINGNGNGRQHQWSESSFAPNPGQQGCWVTVSWKQSWFSGPLQLQGSRDVDGAYGLAPGQVSTGGSAWQPGWIWGEVCFPGLEAEPRLVLEHAVSSCVFGNCWSSAAISPPFPLPSWLWVFRNHSFR